MVVRDTQFDRRFADCGTRPGGTMTETITTTQLLDFLAKAGRVASRVEVRKQVQGMYQIGIHCDWGDEDSFYTQTTCISEDGHSTCKGRKYEFEFSVKNRDRSVHVDLFELSYNFKNGEKGIKSKDLFDMFDAENENSSSDPFKELEGF